MLVKTKPARLFQHTWHAVKVVGKGKACRAAEELRDKRFLSDKAPRLPLPECSSPSRCGCFYAPTENVVEIYGGRRIAEASLGPGSGIAESATDGGRTTGMNNRRRSGSEPGVRRDFVDFLVSLSVARRRGVGSSFNSALRGLRRRPASACAKGFTSRRERPRICWIGSIMYWAGSKIGALATRARCGVRWRRYTMTN